ncbi:MAG: diguanylate cyclase [Desulfovibrionaceae bacterium]|nr:diguanylate cyclase [Desulfovibrionaceae bacterium]
MNIKNRILMPMVLLVVACGVTVLVASILLFSRELNNSMHNKVTIAMNVIKYEIEEIKTKAHIAAMGVANNPDLINAFLNDDYDELIRTANTLAAMLRVDYCTILDSNGTVIIRTHAPDQYGDGIAHLPQIRSALAGRAGTHIIQGPIVRLGVSAGMPIYDSNMNMLGIVSLGFRLDTPDVTKRLKTLTACEVTLFMNDESVSSTLLSQDGTSALGTTAAEHISEQVLGGKPYIGKKQLFGNEILAIYVPLYGENDAVVGMLLAGYFVAEDLNKIWTLVLYGVLITLAVLAACVILARLIIGFVEGQLQDMLDKIEYRDAMLQSTNDFLRFLYGNAPIGIITIDKVSDFIECNDNLLKMLGVTELTYDDFVDSHSPEYQLDGMRSKDKMLEIVERAQSGERQTFEWIYKSAAGELIPCEVTMAYATHERKSLELNYIYDLRYTKSMEGKISQLELKAEKIYYDALTEIFNRRYFDENVNKIMKSLSRSGDTFSLMMIDIDFFKKYNDTYGHNGGDACLKAVAKALSESITREGDFVARYGGEEFAIVLPHVDENGARLIADKALESIRILNIHHEASDVAAHITVSIGIATGIVARTHIAEDFVKRADEMLYKSKQSGRNRYSFVHL